MTVATSGKTTRVILALGFLGVIATVFAFRPLKSAPRPNPASAVGPQPPVRRHETRRPLLALAPRSAPIGVPEFLDRVPRAEVRAFLDHVLEKIPEKGQGVDGYRFESWPWGDKPTHEAVALKATPGADPEKLIARIMDVGAYKGNIAHVEASRLTKNESITSSPTSTSSAKPLEDVRFHQVLNVPGVAKIQHELVLVDAGTIKGYRVAYWYLLKDETKALDRKDGARSAFNVGAWFAAPNVVGYAFSSWPERSDVNWVQWVTLTGGSNAMAKKVVEGNIDGMAAWAKR
jgi:hypothetical protein